MCTPTDELRMLVFVRCQLTSTIFSIDHHTILTMTKAPKEGTMEFADLREIYYGTDDGFDKAHTTTDTPNDIDQHTKVCQFYEAFCDGIAADRRQNIHYASVVGGLFGLNLIPIVKPQKITFFDINPYAPVLFSLLKRVWVTCESSEEFLRKLQDADYEVGSEDERVIQTCLVKKQNGTLLDTRYGGEGRTSHSLKHSWYYALTHFELTRELFLTAEVNTFCSGIHEEAFKTFVSQEPNLWIYFSNVFAHKYSDLVFDHPKNAVAFACHHDEPEACDISAGGQDAATLLGRVPMAVA